MTTVMIVGRKGQIDESPTGNKIIVPEAKNNPIGLTIKKIIKVLKSHSYQVLIDEDTYYTYPSLPAMAGVIGLADVIVAVGGDGTLIDAARQANYNTPLIGVNQGRLGFITDVPADTAAETILKMLSFEEYSVEERHLLQLYSHGELLGTALNDIVFNRVGGRMVEFKVSIWTDADSVPQFAYKARADGLLIATPTGSTAYALAAGGSIINPTARVTQVIPMFPQTLAYSPLIIPDTSDVFFELVSGKVEAWIDGQGPHRVAIGDQEICVSKATEELTLWHPRTDTVKYDYWNTLRQKLNWHLEPGTK